MPTSSFTKNFSIKSKNNARKLAAALDKSQNIKMELSRPIPLATDEDLKEMFSNFLKSKAKDNPQQP